MILRHLTKHVKDQNWFAVGLDFFIVVVGVFVGLQVQQWSQSIRSGRCRSSAICWRISKSIAGNTRTVSSSTCVASELRTLHSKGRGWHPSNSSGQCQTLMLSTIHLMRRVTPALLPISSNCCGLLSYSATFRRRARRTYGAMIQRCVIAHFHSQECTAADLHANLTIVSCERSPPVLAIDAPILEYYSYR